MLDGRGGEGRAERGGPAGTRADGGAQGGEVGGDGVQQEFRLVADVPVERRGGDADLGRDVRHGDRVVAAPVELPRGGGEDLRPPSGGTPDDPGAAGVPGIALRCHCLPPVRRR